MIHVCVVKVKKGFGQGDLDEYEAQEVAVSTIDECFLRPISEHSIDEHPAFAKFWCGVCIA